MLQASYPHITFYPGQAAYNFETLPELNYTESNYKKPHCVFIPKDARDVSFAVQLLKGNNTKFAVRGGGHMAIPGCNSIDAPGVMLSTTNLNTLALSDDETMVSVGPGNRWADVYAYLQPHDLVAVGGRVGEIGVPGLLLGGGISFYSNQYGFASDNVVNYECVLADESIIEATANNIYSDLFWALKAGGNSFCIVTRFDLTTYKSSQVWVGTAQYSANQSSAFLNGVYNFAKHGALDAKAAITPIISVAPTEGKIRYLLTRFYDSEADSPIVWQNFSTPHMAPVSDSYKLQPLSTFIDTYNGPVTGALRRAVSVVSSIVDREAINIVHTTLIDMAIKRLTVKKDAVAGVAIQPLSAEFIRQGYLKGGNPQGIDLSRAPYLITELNLAWVSKADDAYMYQFVADYTAKVNDLLARAGLGAQYLYLNDADEGQRVFESYGKENLERLKSVREKYDPLRVYSELMPGGWKVLNA
ncbi:FAD binding domain-containing protein [Paraphoma chrysanthemicola]|uniref:FAD binding domain-containing protein n=1 Tax=Paraphoma chrysanthemicola TaxID=798071 RepID=A0A8K0R991_9PLEO|nr:FAD binding domain-containing protein [Paraphoma chrysanthemicola]